MSYLYMNVSHIFLNLGGKKDYRAARNCAREKITDTCRNDEKLRRKIPTIDVSTLHRRQDPISEAAHKHLVAVQDCVGRVFLTP